MQDSPCQELKQYKLNLRHDFFCWTFGLSVISEQDLPELHCWQGRNHSVTLSTQIFASSLIPLADKHRQIIIDGDVTCKLSYLCHWSHPPALSLLSAQEGSGSERCALSGAGRTILHCGMELSRWCLAASPGTAYSCSWIQNKVRRQCQKTLALPY